MASCPVRLAVVFFLLLSPTIAACGNEFVAAAPEPTMWDLFVENWDWPSVVAASAFVSAGAWLLWAQPARRPPA